MRATQYSMNNTINIGQTWKDGEQVTGVYCDQPFSGKLDSSASRLSPDGRQFIFVVTLDSPVSVYGEARNSVEVWQ